MNLHPSSALHVHRAERSDRLVGALAALLADPLPDPFASEIVCVPTRGVERWLSQELSLQLGARSGQGDGVCAGVDFPSPRRLVRLILAAVLDDEPAGIDAWRPDQLVWPLLRVIDDARGEDWAALLWSSFGREGAPSVRRWSTARHLADLYAGYASTRPAMVEHWRGGRDLDGAGDPLPSDRAWQAELWRRLRTTVDRPSPVERTSQAVERLRAGHPLTGVPDRVSVFGATRLDPDHLQILAALAERRDVHLWLPHPSPVLWDRLMGVAPARRRVDDRSETVVRHRLLAYLGRDCRELQQTLDATAMPAVDVHYPADEAGPPTTLLGRLQADLTLDRATTPDERMLLDPADRSIVVHASHGPDRQVEVLREVLVGLLADDPALEPRDVIVMCPDIETYAPLIAASFGLGGAEPTGSGPAALGPSAASAAEAEHPGHRLRVRLADRSLRQLNPLLALISMLVGLAESRMTASALLDLCSAGPVARRFGFRTDDLDRLRELVWDAGVRWGLDAAHREPFGMGDFRQNTWSAGLDRLLLGVAMDETDQHFIGTTLPMDDVDSADVDLVGRLVECVRRVETITDACRVRQSVESWMELFRRALELLTSVPPADSWQVGHAYTELGRLAENADPGATVEGRGSVELGLPEVSALLSETFRGRPSRANFRTGTLTMCTMAPMRSVPHRVVCLLGVDDGVFPRSTPVDGDDIRTVDEWVGDRSERSEDRQLLLDAVMAAESRLVVVYAGMDPRTGARTPPAVPISQLLAALEATARTAGGGPVADAITIRHPLQPFDDRNFVAGALDPGPRPFSFDAAALRGVRAAAWERVAPSTTTVVALPPLEPFLPTVADLIRFLGHPLRALLRDRANLYPWREEDEPDEQLPAGLDGLGRWQIGERLLQQSLRGRSLDALAAAEWRRGTLPPRVFGQVALDRILQSVTELSGAAAPYLDREPQRYEVQVELADGIQLTGAVPRVYGDNLVRVTFSRLTAKHRLQSWVELLALAVAHPDTSWRAVTIGSGRTSLLGPVPPDGAVRVLSDLVDLQRVGLREPLPFAPRISAEYADQRELGRPVDGFVGMLEKTWTLERDTTYEQFFGAGVTVADLLTEAPATGEARWGRDEPSRFGTLARRVFYPLLSKEDLS